MAGIRIRGLSPIVVVLALLGATVAVLAPPIDAAEAADAAEGPLSVLMVTATATGTRDDRTIKTTLETAGYNVQIIADETITPQHTTDTDVILITTTTAPARIGTTLTNLPTPIVNYKALLHDDLGLTAPGTQNRGESGSTKTINITNPTHPIATTTQTNGPTQVLTRNSRTTYGKPAPDATIIATQTGRDDRAVIFTYNTGDTLANGTPAPAKRAALFPSAASDAYLNQTGNNLLTATIQWAITPSGPSGPPANRPPNVDAGDDRYGSQTTVNLMGVVTDDELPTESTLTSVWSGPTGVTFDDPSSLSTSATLPGVGIYELTLTADDGELAGSDTVTVTVTDPNGPLSVLMVTATATGTRDDQTIKTTLETAGYNVQIIADETITPQHTTNTDVILITTTTAPAQIGTTLTNLPTPIVNYKALLHDDLGLTAPGTQNRGESGSTKTINITNPTHPIATTTQTNGPTQVLTRNSRTTYGKPAPDATIIATQTGRDDRAVIFTYNTGDTLANGTPAPAKRAALFPSAASDAYLNQTGNNLLTATIQWAARNAPPVAAGSVGVTSGPAPLVVAVDASASSDSDGQLDGYLWDFGDGNQATEIQGSHTFTEPGVYQVDLTVTDSDGATDTTRVATVTVSSAALRIVSGGPSFGRTVIDNTVEDVQQIVAADFNGDGLMDIMAGDAYFRQDPIGSLVRSPLDIDPGAEQDPEPAPHSQLDGAWPDLAVDLDRDGDVDLLSVDADQSTVTWFANTGFANTGLANTDSADFISQVIAADGSNPVVSPQAIDAADLDGDQDIDLLVGHSGGISWLENDGAENWTSQPIATWSDEDSFRSSTALAAADFDRDGDLDVVSLERSNNAMRWYENDGSQTFTERTIDDGVNDPADLAVADIDGDGIADIVVAASLADTVYWYRGDSSGGFARQTVTAETNQVAAVVAADLDGDGDVDIASANGGDNTVGWFTNDGTGTFTGQDVSDSIVGAANLVATDIDGDGDLDLISVARTSSEVVIHTNTRRQTVEVPRGESVVIDATMLISTAPGSSAAEVSYSLTEAPIQGTLRRNGIDLRPGAIFTQADINDGLIDYSSDAAAWADRFRYTVTDGGDPAGSGLPRGIFAIAVNTAGPEGLADLPDLSLDETYSAHLELIRSQTIRNTNHDDSVWRDVPQRELDISDDSSLFGSRTDYLGSPNGNPEQSFPVRQGGQFRVSCEFSHFAYDDPILFPNQPGRSHLHMMFGNTDVNAYSTYETLKDSGSSTCSGQELNRSGYWAPAMIDGDGNARIPERVVVYYKAAGTGQGKTQPFKPAMANIAPSPLSVPEVPTFDGGEQYEVNYKCSNNSSAYPFATGIEEIPNCDGDFWFDTYGAPYPATRTVLEMEIKFWHCFDPTGAVDDWQQWVPSGLTRGSWFYGNCDGRGGQSTGAPPLDDKDFYPAVVYYVNYVVEPGEDTSEWFLASDVDPATLTEEPPSEEPPFEEPPSADGGPQLIGPRGGMHHADWWGAWHPAINWEFLDECVNYHRWPADSGCGFGYLSDGGPDNAEPFSGRALRYRPQYDEVGDGTWYKVPLQTLFEELCEPLGPDHEYSVPASGALCIPSSGAHGAGDHGADDHGAGDHGDMSAETAVSGSDGLAPSRVNHLAYK